MRFLLVTLLLLFHGSVFGKPDFMIIGHRGASGYLPEHTLESYKLAIEMGADFIEPDLVVTKDGVLIARHENNITETTDVESKFPARKVTKIIDGESTTGFFTEDFTISEIKTLRAKERLPFRNHTNDGKFEIPTFAEVLTLAMNHGVGVYPETKHPSYFRAIGLSLEPRLTSALIASGLNFAAAPVIIQSFELSSLKKLRQSLQVRMTYLIDEANKRPYDHVISGDTRSYGDMIKPEGLRETAKIANNLGPWKGLILPVNADGSISAPTSLVADAHAAGLKIHAYTFRSDREFLNASYGGDPAKEYFQFMDLGIDGVFSDFTDHAVHARKEYNKCLKTLVTQQ